MEDNSVPYHAHGCLGGGLGHEAFNLSCKQSLHRLKKRSQRVPSATFLREDLTAFVKFRLRNGDGASPSNIGKLLTASDISSYGSFALSDMSVIIF